jgi:2-amino-4-hydroxy-6-hydroxymethyldihydropteridine diphosphokinase
MLAPIYIALGSNLGNSLLELHQAFHFLKSINSDKAPITSAIYESAAIGPSSNNYLNAVCRLDHCNLMPFNLLKEIKVYEKKRGRNLEDPKWSARIIDLDILLMGDLVVQSTDLSIPHKFLEERNFVLVPLLSLGYANYGYAKRESLLKTLSNLSYNPLQRTHLAWPTQQ